MNKLLRKFIVVLLPITMLCIGFAFDVDKAQAGGGTSSSQQLHYRFRDDTTALNTTGGWLTAGEDQQATNLAKNTTYRVRFTASQEGTAIDRNITPTLEYGTNADCVTGMTDVPTTATTEHFQYTTSAQYADGDATTTNLLTAGEPNRQNGTGEENDGSNFDLDVDYYTEYEYAFIITNNATNGGTYYLRMSNDLDSYPACASLTVATPSGITVSGNVYSNETPTYYNCNSDPLTIKVSIDAGAADSGTCDATNGTYSIATSSPPSAGSEVVVYVDSAELNYKGTTITLAADGVSNISNLHLYQNVAALTYESGSSITNTNLANGDNTEAGIRYAVSGTDLTVETGIELHVWAGKTYDPGGQVDTVTGDLHVDDNATAYIDTAGSVIAGDIVVDGGTTSTTLQFQANAQVDGGAITTLDGGGSNATISYTGTPTVTVTGTGNIGGGTSPSITFYGLTIGTAVAASTTLASNATVAGLLTVDASDTLSINSSVTLSNTGSSDVAGTGTISGSGTLRFTSASGGAGTTLTTLSSIVRYDASGGNIASTTFDGRTYGGQVEIFSDNTAAAAREVAMANSTYTLSGASSHLYIINNSNSYTLTLNGALNPTVSVGGDLDYTGTGSSSEIITSGTGTWTVSGNVNFTDGTFTATSGNTFQMNGSSKTITTATNSLQNFTVTGGSVSNADAMTVAGNFQVNNTATFTLHSTANLTVTGDNIVIQNGGTYTKSDTSAKFIMDGISNDQWFDDQNATKQNMGSVQIGASPGTTKLKSDFAATDLTILTGDVFETHGWEVDLSGSLDCQGTCTLDLQDDLPNNDTTDPTTITFGGNWTMSATGTFIPFTNSRVEPDGTADQTVSTGGKAFWNFYSNNAGATDAVDDVIISNTFDVDGALTVNDGELDLETNDPTTDIEGNISITFGAELNASSTGSFNAAGSWDNNGTFTANSSTVTFDSSAGTETVEAGSSSFNIVVFNHASGSWTIQTDNMTTTGNLTLTAATAFSVASVTLEVQGNLNLSVSGANTTWTGSTLYLNGSGGMYDINTKTHGGDTFATLRIGANEDIAMWDSSAATAYTIDAGGCLFSQDHGGTTAGRLNIYGTCSSRANEYWSYAKDFGDGAAVTRQADVRFAPGASLTVDNGDSLEILGQSAGANRSLISRDSTGTYGLTISGTINAQYYDFDYLNASGLNITSTATVTELSDGSFDNAGAASASYITVNGITSGKNFYNNVFDDSGDGTDANVVYNVNADGAGIDWTFFEWSGNRGGEDYDLEANNAFVGWNSELTLSVNDNVMDLGMITALTIGSDNHTITVTTNAANGYTCRAVDDGNLRNGAFDINDVLDGTVTAGAEEYGLSCSGADCDLTGDNALSGTPLQVASNAARVTGSATTMTYKAAASATTVGISYSHVVTFTCTGDF